MGKSLIETACDRIDLWRIDLAADRAAVGADLLCAAELERADKFAFSKDRQQYVRSRGALRSILSRYVDCPARELEFSYNQHGKPELHLPGAKQPTFNLSHTMEVALIAVTRRRKVGVDLSTLQGATGQSLEWMPVAKRSFSNAEQSLLFALPVTAQERMFYQIWCQKEAYTKAIGEGYRYGFQSFTVAVDPAQSCALIADEKNPGFVGEWQIAGVDVGASLIAALACE